MVRELWEVVKDGVPDPPTKTATTSDTDYAKETSLRSLKAKNTWEPTKAHGDLTLEVSRKRTSTRKTAYKCRSFKHQEPVTCTRHVHKNWERREQHCNKPAKETNHSNTTEEKIHKKKIRNIFPLKHNKHNYSTEPAATTSTSQVTRPRSGFIPEARNPADIPSVLNPLVAVTHPLSKQQEQNIQPFKIWRDAKNS